MDGFLGKVHGNPVGVAEADWLRWIRPDGRVLPTGEELAREETARADAATARADAATARAEELEAEIRKLRSEPR